MKKSLSLMALAVLSLVGLGQSRPAGNVAALTDSVNDGLPGDNGCGQYGCIVIGIRG